MQKIKWKTVKIDKEGLLHLSYTDIEDKQSAKVIKYFEQPAHPDLIAAMEKLTPHFAIICEQIEVPESIEDIDAETELEVFVVRGFHRGSNDEIPGITIVGHKVLKSGKILGLNAPFLRFHEDDGDNNAYAFQSELEEVCAEIEIEAELYVKGKFKPDPQARLPFESSDNGDKSKTTVGVLEPEKGSAFDTVKAPAKGKKKEPVKAAKAAKKSVGKNKKVNHLGQELSDNALPVK